MTLTELIESCRPHPPAKPNLLKTLLTIQEAYDHVPAGSLTQIARVLGVTEADAAGVLSYYPDLRTVPPGRHVIRVCLGESCMANHSPAVVRAIEDYLGHGTADAELPRRFTLEKVYCVGNCALSPTVVVGQDVHGRVAPAQVPSILERYR
jgi:NADH:ubiquinone oxidoreductase subunit E